MIANNNNLPFLRSLISGMINPLKNLSSAAACRCSFFSISPNWSSEGLNLLVNQGVNANAANKENNIATEPKIGMGDIYGPIMPLTKPIGNNAAITVKVARIVGFPTSRTASTATSTSRLSESNQRR